ncbi:MAG TPA: hypothetical protein VE863_11890 [Pyrinomonadaceae bacterium]|nr:hypothetical protein [Pyrinomonadaceae bacterium]
MNWINAISQLLGTLVWPLTVLAIALLYRRQLRGLLARVAKIEYPGGSITILDVSRLEKTAADARELPSSSPAPERPPRLISQDTNVVLAQLRTDMERELFRIAQIKSHGAKIQFVSLAETLRELRNTDAIPTQLAVAIEEFADIHNRMASDSTISNEMKERVAITANGLLTQLHKHRLIVEMEYEFDAHGLWHMHGHLEEPARRYYWWSAVAASCPEFEYDYDVYRIAAERHNDRLIRQMGRERARKGIIEVISPTDYLSVLYFRESELRRVLAAYENGQEAFSKANEWKWPEEWGNVSWSGPVVRGWLRDVERELMETQNAIRRYDVAGRAT